MACCTGCRLADKDNCGYCLAKLSRISRKPTKVWNHVHGGRPLCIPWRRVSRRWLASIRPGAYDVHYRNEHRLTCRNDKCTTWRRPVHVQRRSRLPIGCSWNRPNGNPKIRGSDIEGKEIAQGACTETDDQATDADEEICEYGAWLF